MNTSYVFFANGFEEIEALATVDIMRRAGMDVVTVSINEGTLEVEGAHGVSIKADAMIADVDLANAQWLICPGGMPGATNLAACTPLTDALKAQNAEGGHLAAICASPSVVFGPLGLLQGRNAVCYPAWKPAWREPSWAATSWLSTATSSPDASPQQRSHSASPS